MREKSETKSYWPAFAGALLFAVVAALTEFRGLLWLLEHGYTHWKFGAVSYYEMSIWLMQWLIVFLAVGFLVLASVVIRLAPKIPWYACMMASVILGLGTGLQMVRVHHADLRSPKVGSHEDFVRLQ